MNEQQTISKASEITTALEAYAHAHPVIFSAAIAIVLSWFVTGLFKKPIRALLPDAWDAWGVRAFDCVVAGLAAFYLFKKAATGAGSEGWPLEWRVIGSMLVGFGSPTVYGVLAWAICSKFPSARRFLTLSELENEPHTPPASAEAPPPGN